MTESKWLIIPLYIVAHTYMHIWKCEVTMLSTYSCMILQQKNKDYWSSWEVFCATIPDRRADLYNTGAQIDRYFMDNLNTTIRKESVPFQAMQISNGTTVYSISTLSLPSSHSSKYKFSHATRYEQQHHNIRPTHPKTDKGWNTAPGTDGFQRVDREGQRRCLSAPLFLLSFGVFACLHSLVFFSLFHSLPSLPSPSFALCTEY